MKSKGTNTTSSVCVYLSLGAVIPCREFLAGEERRVAAFGAHSTMLFEEYLNVVGLLLHRTVRGKTTSTSIR
jgi:hypothetical protein